MALGPAPDERQDQWTTAQVTVTVQFVRPTRASPKLSPRASGLTFPRLSPPISTASPAARGSCRRYWTGWSTATERIFLLTGGPGTGKSMILAWLAGYGPAPADPARGRATGAAARPGRGSALLPGQQPQPQPSGLCREHRQPTHCQRPRLRRRARRDPGRARADPSHREIGTSSAGASVTGVSIGRLDLGTLGDELSFDRAFTQPVKKLYECGL